MVLLIDGLDEAVDLPAARRWVISAAADVGESQVVVASRPIGYKEPSAAFKTLTICPLAAEQQTELLTRWITDRAKVTAALERLSRPSRRPRTQPPRSAPSRRDGPRPPPTSPTTTRPAPGSSSSSTASATASRRRPSSYPFTFWCKKFGEDYYQLETK